MRRVVLGTTLLEPGRGGISAVARMTMRVLKNMGHELEVLSFLDKAPYQLHGQRIWTARGSKALYAAACALKGVRSDFHVYDSTGMARAHPGFLRKSYAVWIHGIEVWDYLHKERERALRKADLVLVNSHFTLQRFQEKHWSLENACVCPLATEEDTLPVALPDFSGPPAVFTLGTIERNGYKGHRELIKLWQKIVDQVPDAQLIMAGGGSGLEEMRALARRSSVADRIQLLGFVPDDKLPKLWRRAHVFAMPSRGEGFGIVYVQAMRYGLPVIASVHDAGQEVNRHGITGYNVNMDKPDELVEAIVYLLKNTNKAKELGQNGRKLWEREYRFSKFAERLEKALRNMS